MVDAASNGARGDRLVFIGDVHLERDDPALDAFLSFLETLGETSRRIVLMGDLFNLWIGRRSLEQPHQTAVANKLAALRRRGLRVGYLEGNRDYHVAAGYVGHALDESSLQGIVEDYGGHRIYAVHGDLVNVADRQYRAWRRLSRTGFLWRLFNLLPRRSRLRLAEGLEARMRGTNLQFKQEFPEATVRGYARELFRSGHDILVLGHFHVERDLSTSPPDPPGRIFVLPEWKGSRRHLEVRPDGAVGFVDS
jgi:UDP-2,3-diacylglucosamine hydrolase